MAPSNRDRFVAVKLDDVISIHATSDSGAYDTLCGIDANDPVIGHEGTVPLPAQPKIDCVACKRIVKFCWQYKPKDLNQ